MSNIYDHKQKWILGSDTFYNIPISMNYIYIYILVSVNIASIINFQLYSFTAEWIELKINICEIGLRLSFTIHWISNMFMMKIIYTYRYLLRNHKKSLNVISVYFRCLDNLFWNLILNGESIMDINVSKF